MEELKKCPDCAETVRAEARVCRFCGYRFDRRPGGGGSIAAAGALAGLLRRPSGPTSLPEVLDDWGCELDAGETVAYFGYCRLDRAYGFLLITDARVAFFSGRGGRRIVDWPLAALSAIERGGGWAWPRLRVSGPDRTVTLRRLESRRALADVARLLGAA